VINDHPDVSEKTRSQINQVVARLGYQPSNLARSLIQGPSRTVGMVGSGLKYFGPASILSAVEERASVLGYSLLLTVIRQPETNDVEGTIQNMLSRHVDGIVLAVPEIGNNQEWIERLLPTIPVPVVFLSIQPRAGVSVVEFDNRSGGRMATRHLIEQGYQRIGLVTGPLSWASARQRQLGWQDALEEADLEVEPEAIVEGDWSPSSGELGLYRLLERCPHIDAVFVCNDQMALGALRAAYTMGRRVPDELAIIGFDDIPEAAYFCPSLTTIRQDRFALGYAAMQELNRLMDATNGHKVGSEPRATWIPVQLVVRESSARSKLLIERQGG
jgi:DNA-binding LacI/PurR family transcriptional regulator